MKLEKITEGNRRYYSDACGTAHALDLLGERWAILVVRELLLGPRRFSDLRTGLPGISANVLTQRLEGLEEAGLVVRRRLPPPASVQVYELTEWGRQVEPIVVALGRWGARSPIHDPTLPLSPVSMMLSFRAMFDPLAAKDVNVRLGVRCGAEAFALSVADGELRGEKLVDGSAEAHGVETEISGAPGKICAAVYRFEPLETLEASGDLAVKGDRGALDRFAGVFTFPARATLAAARE